MGQGNACISSLMDYMLKKFYINVITPYNHQSLQAEYSIKSLSTILTKHVTGIGQLWPKYLPLAELVYNTFKIQT